MTLSETIHRGNTATPAAQVAAMMAKREAEIARLRDMLRCVRAQYGVLTTAQWEFIDELIEINTQVEQKGGEG